MDPSESGVIESGVGRQCNRRVLWGRRDDLDGLARRVAVGSVTDGVRDEMAEVVGDVGVDACAHTQTSRFTIDHPHTRYRVFDAFRCVERGGRCEVLDDETLCSVLAGLLSHHLPVTDGDDVGALATEERLLDVVLELFGLFALEPGWDQEDGPVVVAEQLPEHREDAFVAPQHLVRRLDPDRATDVLAGTVAPADVLHVCEAGTSELLLDHELPRVELEDHVDVIPLLVVEASVVAENDVLDVDGLDLVAGLLAGVEQHEGVHDILAAVFVCAAGEVHDWPVAEGLLDELEIATPGHDQLFTDVVPLVVALTSLTKPLPLRERSFHEAGRGVGVELVQPGAAEFRVVVV